MTDHQKTNKAVLGGEEYLIPFQPTLAVAFGVLGALILQQVHYWTTEAQNVQEDYSWVYNTYEQWADQIVVYSAIAIRKKMKELESGGVLVAGVFNKKRYDRTRWYRLDYQKLASVLHSKTGKTWQILSQPSGKKYHMVLVETIAPIPENTTKTTTEITGFGASTAPHPITHEIDSSGEPDMLKKNPPTTTPKKGSVKLSSDQILAQLQLNALALDNKPVSVGSLITVWRETVPKCFLEVKLIPEFTLVQKGMLAKVLKAWGGPSNKQSLKVMEYLLSHWVKFTKHVQTSTNAKSSPELPNVPFLLKYCAEGYNLYLSEESPEKTPAVVKVLAVAETPIAEPMKPIEAPISLNELEEIGAQFGFGPKKE